MFDRAVEAADPMRCVAEHLPDRPERLLVIGAGKASARMAEAVEAAWGPCEGLVITRYGYARPCKGIDIVEASHPVPDEAGANATGRMLNLVRRMGEGDTVLALISGGASSLLCAPRAGLSLGHKQAIGADLLASGAPIGQMNTVRKHLSEVKGGQLAAAAYPARLLCLMISDVPGDDPADIGSGPTVAEATCPADAAAIMARLGLSVPDCLSEPQKVIAPDDPRLSTTENRVISAPAQSLAAAAKLAEGIDIHLLGDALEGEARTVAAEHAEHARQMQAGLNRPAILLSGGELTVTRTGTGVGGPNAEYALALALALDGAAGIHAIACDTDGVDGAAEVAGALIGPNTLTGTDQAARDALADNDAHSYFATVGAQVVTGPTLTNVNDFRAILIQPPDHLNA
ncbi:MAG: glycerate kinase [Pseudomonadota bacterium]